MKPESRFIQSVHRHIDRSKVYFEKTNNPYRCGTPDVYYEGEKNILWVEYKYIKKLTNNYRPAITPLQRKWLKRAYSNDVNVAVITGTLNGACIHSVESWWDTGNIMSQESLFLMSPMEVAQWIVETCTR